MGILKKMEFIRGIFSKKEPPTKEEELNNKEFSKFRSNVPCQKVVYNYKM
jgi:hypothetical protein